MSDTADTITRYHASLSDEVLAILETSQEWLSAHALLQRCELARDGEQLGDTLAKHVKAGRLQAHADRLGLLYAASGLPKPADRVRDARGPASNAETLVEAAPRQRADIAAIRQVNVAAKLEAVRTTLVSLFQQQPLRSCRELQGALNKSQPVVSGYLRAMCEEGLINPVGKGSAIRFRWLGETTEAPAPSPAPIRNESVPEPAQIEVVEPKSTTTRYALFSDGGLLINIGSQELTLSKTDTRHLATFLASTNAKDLVCAP